MKSTKNTFRKIIRWFAGLFLIIGAINGLLVVFQLSVPIGLAATFLLAACLMRGKLIGTALAGALIEVIVGLVAALAGVVRAMCVQRFFVWNLVKSR
ncbi:hypothetical protein [Asticcacaulis benevestitus]|uniref:Uncharacterized protein n=1 Tax=Asticcacaulis benevestitus DSM 16100 = ATCC BAA-896 TaxID=1121022 RepID=V4P643_9CAUL|nr:hypothetical protein [Asticcacaulis benevestitus]ESQ89432.1 hypothetical protein ABENE_13720 [Asticcacaulis benevestitus DSM 16100 = ATCC BAA-896]